MNKMLIKRMKKKTCSWILQNEESFQTLNYSIDTLAHLHGLEDFATDDGENGLLRQESIEDVMQNRQVWEKPTILDSGSTDR